MSAIVAFTFKHIALNDDKLDTNSRMKQKKITLIYKINYLKLCFQFFKTHYTTTSQWLSHRPMGW